MNLLLMIFLVAAVVMLLMLVGVQAGRLRERDEVVALWREKHGRVSAEARSWVESLNARSRVEQERFAMACKVRLLQEEQIAFLKRACEQMGEYIRTHLQPGQQPPDDADWWKKQ